MSEYSIPLTIGVTGHRDLLVAEIPELEAQLHRFIDELQTRYPNLPLRFLTGIAEGADSLVAAVAASRGCKLLNVLPMPAELYREDFQGDARARFERLWQEHETLELDISGQDQIANKPAGIDRERQYERLGVFLAAHCHLLLAVWDGESNGGPGGTAEVVRFHQRDITSLAGLEQHRPELDVSEDESDLVYHIVCSRDAAPKHSSSLVPGTAWWLSRDHLEPRTVEMPRRYDRVFQRMSEFNADIAQKSSLETGEQLAPDKVPSRSAACCADIQEAFCHCDSLAAHYQWRTLFALRSTLSCALAAGLAFIIYADFANQEWSIYLYLVLVSGALLAFRAANRNGWQRKYVDYRVLAEALRVQYYWALAGVSMDNPSRFSHDRFFQGRDLDLGWIRNVLRSTGLRSDGQQAASASDVKLAVENWVGTETTGQFGYYRTKASQRLRQHLATSRLTKACFIGGVIAALTLAVGQRWLPGALTNLLVALMGLLPLIAAARQNYAHRVGERELVAQYAQMNTVFSNASRLLTNIDSKTQAQSILQDLGEAALNENAQWVLRQRERPLPGGDAIS